MRKRDYTVKRTNLRTNETREIIVSALSERGARIIANRKLGYVASDVRPFVMQSIARKD